jgi:hypothetical protein
MYPIEDPIVYRVTHVSRQVSVCARVARQRDGERPPSKRHHRRLPDRTPTAGVRVADMDISKYPRPINVQRTRSPKI